MWPAQAVEDDAIDILAVSAPDCRFMPQSIIDLLHDARSSVLVYHCPAPTGGAAVDTEAPLEESVPA